MSKTYAVEIIGQKEPTYIVESDMIKLVKATNTGARLVMAGKSFINPSSIARIRRAYDIDASVIEEADQEVVSLLEGREIKKLT